MVPGNLAGMLWLKEETEDENRYGFVISKKISKRAVDRNKIKRLLSEAVKKNEVGGKGYKIVFLAKKSLLGKKFAEVEKETVIMLAKIK